MLEPQHFESCFYLSFDEDEDTEPDAFGPLAPGGASLKPAAGKSNVLLLMM
jgi:hypothetical protein